MLASVQFIFSAYLIDPPIIVLFSTFVHASGHQFNYSRRADGPFIPQSKELGRGPSEIVSTF
jgi:hypothetical protein